MLNQNLINLTPHQINILDINNDIINYKPSGTIARLQTEQEMVDMINDHDIVVKTITGILDLPEPVERTFFIVSAMVRDTCPDRFDILSPDTGPTAIRNSQGHIVAVRGFIINRKAS